MDNLITKTAKEIQEQCNAGASVSDVISLLDDFKKQLNLGVVIRGLLGKEAKDIGCEVEDLYLSIYEDEIYLEVENEDDYYFSLREVKRFK